MFGKTKITIKIKGMDCEHCAHHVKTALENLDEIDKAEVNLKKEEATVTIKSAIAESEKDKTAALEAMAHAVKEAGYEVVS